MIHNDSNAQVTSRGLLFGTCTELARAGGIPTWIVRTVAVVALCMWFKLTLIAYCGGAIYYRYRR